MKNKVAVKVEKLSLEINPRICSEINLYDNQ